MNRYKVLGVTLAVFGVMMAGSSAYALTPSWSDNTKFADAITTFCEERFGGVTDLGTESIGVGKNNRKSFQATGGTGNNGVKGWGCFVKTYTTISEAGHEYNLWVQNAEEVPHVALPMFVAEETAVDEGCYYLGVGLKDADGEFLYPRTETRYGTGACGWGEGPGTVPSGTYWLYWTQFNDSKKPMTMQWSILTLNHMKWDVTLTDVSKDASALKDISNSKHKDNIVWAYRRGITSGTTGSTYSPKQAVTREQMATFMYRTIGEPSRVIGTTKFTDIGSSKHKDDIKWLSGRGITSGTSATTYGPKQKVTREQMATFLYRLAGAPSFTMPATPTFKDISGSQHQKAIEWLAATGITSGTSATTYSPKQAVTREQMATFLMKFVAFL